jgi:diphosphomevalonate decarboxylase
MISSAVSHPNKALVIYWGNDNHLLNIPTRSSLSMNLYGINRPLNYYVTMKTSKNLDNDIVLVNNKEEKGEIYSRIIRHLNLMRRYTRFKEKIMISTKSTFPVGAGLAGSAASASALAQAFVGLFDKNLDKRGVSILARMGSGSGARSVYGGFVKLQKDDNQQPFGEQVFDEKYWDVRDIIAVVDPSTKKINSREGMMLSKKSCSKEIYSNFVSIADLHMKEIRSAIKSKNMGRLGEFYEKENLLFRKVCLNTNPPLDYWSKITQNILLQVTNLRLEGILAYAGTDAGPNVHVFTLPIYSSKVIESIQQIPGINSVIQCRPGEGSRSIHEHLL